MNKRAWIHAGCALLLIIASSSCTYSLRVLSGTEARLQAIKQQLDELPVQTSSRTKLAELYKELYEIWKTPEYRQSTVPIFRQLFDKYIDITLVRIESDSLQELSQINLDQALTQASIVLGWSASEIAPRFNQAKQALHAKINERRKTQREADRMAKQQAREENRLRDAIQEQQAAAAAIQEQQAAAAALAAEAEAAAQAERIKQARKQLLKSGKVTINSFEDALLLHDPAGRLKSLMQAPLLNPDGGIYSGVIVLDGEEDKNLLRVRFEVRGMYLPGVGGAPPNISYAFLRVSGQTKNFAPAELRINGLVQVLGRYVANVKYRTVLRAERTAPVLDALYLDKGD